MPERCSCEPLFSRYGRHLHYPAWLELIGDLRAYQMLELWWPARRRVA